MYEKTLHCQELSSKFEEKNSASAPQPFLPDTLQVRFVRQIMANTTIESGNREKKTV